MSETSFNSTVLIESEVELRTDLSVKFIKLAKKFDAQVEIALADNGPWIDATDIVKVMEMKVPKDTTLYLRASGPQAVLAIDTLVELVENGFYEAGR